MNFNQPKPENGPEKIYLPLIPGYPSFLDKLQSGNEEDKKSVIATLGALSEKLHNCWSLEDMYAILKEVIVLPPAADMKAMRRCLLELDLVDIPVLPDETISDKAMHFINYMVSPRLATLVEKSWEADKDAAAPKTPDSE